MLSSRVMSAICRKKCHLRWPVFGYPVVMREFVSASIVHEFNLLMRHYGEVQAIPELLSGISWPVLPTSGGAAQTPLVDSAGGL